MSDKEPGAFIGITCDVQSRRLKAEERRCQFVCDYRYPEAVKQGGGVPILLPVAYSSKVINRYIDQIDGLIIVGGDDVDPRLYGEKRKKGTGTVYGPRLYFERRLYKEARRRRMPILGVCYGMQLINVLEGGTLFQDIRRDAKSRFPHRGPNPSQKVRIDTRSRLGRIIGRGTLAVYHDHHQAVSRVAPSFRPVAFAPDGIIEAIESDAREIVAVQWHPERTMKHPDSKRLFKWFVRLCQVRARKKAKR